MTTYIFDGSMEGLLTAVFEWFERKPGAVILQTPADYQPDLLSHNNLHVCTDNKKAERVWKALTAKIGREWTRKFYCCYLSEQPKAQQHLFEFTIYIFLHPEAAHQNFGNKDVLAVSQIAHKVEREKHRMEAFVRFKSLQDGTYYAEVEPDFNVLPLIARHFRNRYADQPWVIYDCKRKYGIHYDCAQINEVKMLPEAQKDASPETLEYDGQETLYALLWKDYFKSTNIEARKNIRLHIQHVPRRYWRYLTEKEDKLHL